MRNRADGARRKRRGETGPWPLAPGPWSLSPLCSLHTPAARWMSADDIMAGRAVVEIGGDKTQFEQAVVASQGIVDRFAGKISAMAAKIEESLGPITKMGEGLKKAFDQAGELAKSLGFEEIAGKLETIAGHVEKITEGFAGLGEPLKHLQENLANVGKGGTEGFLALAGAATNAAGVVSAYIDLLGKAHDAGKALGEAGQGKGGNQGDQLGWFATGMYGAASLWGGKTLENSYGNKLALDQSKQMERARQNEEAHLADVRKAQEDQTNWAKPAFDAATGAADGFFSSLATQLIDARYSMADLGTGFVDGLKEAAITGPIMAEIDRLKEAANIPKTPELALASSALRGSSAAADAIAKGSATRLTDDKEKNLDELKKHTALLDQLVKTKQAAGAIVKLFNGN